MKLIYKFTLQEPKKVKKTESITNEKGEAVEQSKYVEELVPRTFVIKRPNRSAVEDLEIFRSITESEYIRRGVLSVNILSKKLIDEGGILSKEEQEDYKKLTEKFLEKQPEYLKLNGISEKDRTEEQNKNYEELLKELTEVMGQIQDFDNKSNNLFNRTAEFLSRNKSALYFTLMQSFEEKDGKYTSVFDGKTFEEKLVNYDKMEESDDKFVNELLQKLLFVSSVYFFGKATTQEEIDSLLNLQDKIGWIT